MFELVFLFIVLVMVFIGTFLWFLGLMIGAVRGGKVAATRTVYRTYDPSEYKSVAWRALRAEVIARDGGRCQFCGAKAETAHHKTYKWGILCDPKHLTAICWPCHNKIHERAIWN